MLHRTLRLLLARGVAAAARKPHNVSTEDETGGVGLENAAINVAVSSQGSEP